MLHNQAHEMTRHKDAHKIENCILQMDSEQIFQLLLFYIRKTPSRTIKGV